MRWLLITVLLAGYLQAQPATITGTVVDQTGNSLAGVHVRFVTGNLGPSASVDVVYGATTDAAGQFHIAALKPELYVVIAEKTGFLQQSSGAGTILALKPGQQLTGYKIVMAARAVFEGHVVDEYGDPVQGIRVQTQSVSKQAENFMLMDSNQVTDDRGEFRLLTLPGKYYIKTAQLGQYGGPPEIRTDGTSGAPFIPTYFPSSASADSASVVEVAAGQDLSGIEIRMLRASPAAPIRGLTISGVVIGAPEGAGVNVMLRYGEKPDGLSHGRGTSITPDGKFQFNGMQPGFYSIAASSFSGKTPLQSRAKNFHLDAADETGIELTLAPGEELNGRLEFTGDAGAGEAGKHTVRLEQAGWGAQYGQWESSAVEVAADGSFQIPGVPPGKFKPVVEPMPENGYLKEVALDEKAQPEQVLDFSEGGSRLKITVSRAGGQVSGRVLGKDGEPAIGLILVFIATDARHIDENNASKSTDGKYSFKGIRPGKYRLVAIDVAETMQAFSGDQDNDEIMQRLFEASEEIQVKEGDRISKDVTAVTKIPEKKEAP